MMLAGTFGRTILPMGHLEKAHNIPRGRPTRPVEAAPVPSQPWARSACSSRSRRLRILPLGFFGSPSAITTCLGVL